ncbi:MAG TPA: TIM barrel protein [Planctomycetota bacterium]|nr:TIM barrel protein [Planctomycetota bacterium]
MPHTDLDRRSLFGLAAAALTLPAGGRVPAGSIRPQPPQDQLDKPPKQEKKKLKQSVCRWIYGDIPLDELCQQAATMGLVAVDLLTANEWMVPKKHGLVCSMAFGPKNMQIHHGLNRLEHHDEFVKDCEAMLPRIQEAGIPNMIVFSGNRGGQDDATGIKNCTIGLQRLQPLAEKAGVTLCLEYLNSKVDHKDYAFDRMQYGLEVCKAVGSKHVKILYDIYHAQIMEGDVIRTIKDNIDWIGHFHTGGVPGRHDIDDTQELNYPAVCRAILDTNYSGYVAHEFVPKKDKLATLARCVKLCDV